MTPENAENLESLWKAKLANHRESRNEAYADIHAKLASNGLGHSGSMPGKFYDIAIQNLGELNSIFKDLTQDGWAIEPDETWANQQLEKYRLFISDEKILVDREIAEFLASKGFGDVSRQIASGKAELELSSKIHETRFPVFVEQLKAEHKRTTGDRLKADRRWKQEHWIRIGTISLLIIAAGINLWTSRYTRRTYALAEKANERTQQLFIGEDSPQLQAIPFAIAETPTHNSTLNFRLVNHSGFDAFDINVDVQYCIPKDRHRHWAGEWKKADKDSVDKTAGGVEHNKGYFFSPLFLAERLNRFQEITTDKQEGFGFGSNALHLEDVCDKDADGLPVLVRLRWRNSKNRTYDEIRKFQLLCTKNWHGSKPQAPKGRSFTMLPMLGISCE